MSKHSKNYNCDAEFAYRLGVYRQNIQFIEEHNRLNKDFTVAINKFADLTATEFGALYNGYRMTDRKQSAEVHTHNPMFKLADDVDWRSQGVVTGVKDQGQCGSCWAFSTTGSVEGAWAIKNGKAKLTSISEQNLVDCSGSYGNYGCDGGLMDNAFQYIIANKGIDTEDSYPYTAADGDCSFKSSSVGSTLSSYKDVASGKEDALTSAIATVGPISVAIDASQSSFQFYSGGVYYEAACSSDQLDHGVLAVGYGTQSGSDFYTVKNSWGADWGSNGYILMSRNKNNNCGIATAASYPIV
jgi:cathepsin L